MSLRGNKISNFLRKNMIVSNSMLTSNSQNSSLKLKSYDESSCRGLYNPAAYTRLEHICRDCFNLFKVVEIYSMCMDGCFNSKHFLQCAKVLLLDESKVSKLIDVVG